jgi:hypothetical protein
MSGAHLVSTQEITAGRKPRERGAMAFAVGILSEREVEFADSEDEGPLDVFLRSRRLTMPKLLKLRRSLK